jgi:hypothetical protein
LAAASAAWEAMREMAPEAVPSSPASTTWGRKERRRVWGWGAYGGAGGSWAAPDQAAREAAVPSVEFTSPSPPSPTVPAAAGSPWSGRCCRGGP